MNGAESETGNSDWTKENLQKLFAAMKESIPGPYVMRAYSKTLGLMDWTHVAFPPFSPEACKKKWEEILKKKRKLRSLTELIDEAETDLQSEVNQIQSAKLSKCSMTRMTAQGYMTAHAERWPNMTDTQKEYRQRCGKKYLHIDGKEMGTGVSRKPSLNLPSDSEDEDIEYSSSEEDVVSQDSHEGEKEEDGGDTIMFDIY